MDLIVHLDTNAYSDWRRAGRWHSVIARADRIVVSTIVLGELLHGFRNGKRTADNRASLEDFLAEPQVEVHPVGRMAAEWFSEFAYDLKKRGTPLPTNDIWIAAVAVEQGAVLLTRDRHFENLPQLRLASFSED